MLEQPGAQRDVAVRSDVANIVVADEGLPVTLDEFFSKRGYLATRDDERRRYARIYYRHAAPLQLRQSLPAFPRAEETVRIYTCDVGRSGIRFVVDRELYPRETLQITLPNVGSRHIQIVRCRKLNAACFEVGARFAWVPTQTDA